MWHYCSGSGGVSVAAGLAGEEVQRQNQVLDGGRDVLEERKQSLCECRLRERERERSMKTERSRYELTETTEKSVCWLTYKWGREKHRAPTARRQAESTERVGWWERKTKGE